VTLGSGNRWGHVYEVLEQYGMAVAGAREAHVGVGGFLLGGGMSWFTARVGFAVDNIVGYEVR
jgi:FAD/FMN-containing dehydrogenase